MATIIYLKDRAPTAKRPMRAAAEEGPLGRILLFTGVRYERLAPGSRPTSTGPASAGPKRAKP